MTVTWESQRDVFRSISQSSYYGWPAYNSTPLYDRSSLGGIEEDVRTVARVWFSHEAHNSVDNFICQLPLAYVEFAPHNRYSDPTEYEMITVVRAFLLKEVHGWDHETPLNGYFRQQPSIRQRFGFRPRLTNRHCSGAGDGSGVKEYSE